MTSFIFFEEISPKYLYFFPFILINPLKKKGRVEPIGIAISELSTKSTK